MLGRDGCIDVKRNDIINLKGLNISASWISEHFRKATQKQNERIDVCPKALI